MNNITMGWSGPSNTLYDPVAPILFGVARQGISKYYQVLKFGYRTVSGANKWAVAIPRPYVPGGNVGYYLADGFPEAYGIKSLFAHAGTGSDSVTVKKGWYHVYAPPKGVKLANYCFTGYGEAYNNLQYVHNFNSSFSFQGGGPQNIGPTWSLLSDKMRIPLNNGMYYPGGIPLQNGSMSHTGGDYSGYGTPLTGIRDATLVEVACAYLRPTGNVEPNEPRFHGDIAASQPINLLYIPADSPACCDGSGWWPFDETNYLGEENPLQYRYGGDNMVGGYKQVNLTTTAGTAVGAYALLAAHIGKPVLVHGLNITGVNTPCFVCPVQGNNKITFTVNGTTVTVTSTDQVQYTTASAASAASVSSDSPASSAKIQPITREDVETEADQLPNDEQHVEKAVENETEVTD